MELALTHRKGHTMPPRPETVRLSPSNWIALVALALTIVVSLVGGVWTISDTINATRYELRTVRETLNAIDKRVERLEGVRGTSP